MIQDIRCSHIIDAGLLELAFFYKLPPLLEHTVNLTLIQARAAKLIEDHRITPETLGMIGIVGDGIDSDLGIDEHQLVGAGTGGT